MAHRFDLDSHGPHLYLSQTERTDGPSTCDWCGRRHCIDGVIVDLIEDVDGLHEVCDDCLDAEDSEPVVD